MFSRTSRAFLNSRCHFRAFQKSNFNVPGVWPILKQSRASREWSSKLQIEPEHSPIEWYQGRCHCYSRWHTQDQTSVTKCSIYILFSVCWTAFSTTTLQLTLHWETPPIRVGPTCWDTTQRSNASTQYVHFIAHLLAPGEENSQIPATTPQTTLHLITLPILRKQGPNASIWFTVPQIPYLAISCQTISPFSL